MDNDPANTPQDSNQAEPVVTTPPDATSFNPVSPSPSDPVPTDSTETSAEPAPVIDVVTPTPVPTSTSINETNSDVVSVEAAPVESSFGAANEAPTSVTDTDTARNDTQVTPSQAPVVAPVVAPISGSVKKPSKTMLILVIILVVIVIGAAVAYFAFMR